MRTGVVLICMFLLAVPAARGASAAVRRNWPCPACITIVPAAAGSARSAPLLVALHGDEGAPDTIAAALAGAAERAGMILFAPQCPTALGCRFEQSSGSTNSWWGWLQYRSTYDDAWLGRQIDQVAAAYHVDAAREYIAGWSGGADLDGAADPRFQSGQPAAVKRVLSSCGSETTMVVLPAADHAETLASVRGAGYGGTIVRWLGAHRQRRTSTAATSRTARAPGLRSNVVRH